MFVARWSFEARFGQKSQALELIREWNAEIGAKAGMNPDKVRITTGSIGAKEALVEIEYPIETLTELQDFFDKIGSMKMHADWGPKMGQAIVSGSTRWDVLRVV